MVNKRKNFGDPPARERVKVKTGNRDSRRLTGPVAVWLSAGKMRRHENCQYE